MYLSKHLLLAVPASIMSLFACAQEQQTPEDRKSYFDFSTYYLSKAVYFGRKDSAFARYIHPAVSYHHKSGLSLEAGLSYQVGNAEKKRIDFYEVDGRYEFSLGKRINAEVYATRLFFYKDVEQQVLPDLKAITGFQTTYDADIVSVNAGADYYVADDNRIILTLGVSHEFEFRKRRRGQWSIEPAISAFGGTQYYYKLPALKPVIDTTAEWEPLQTSRFSLLAYEFSLPVTYQTRHLEFYFKPTYAIPLNAAHAEADYEKEVLKKEVLSNSFFVETGLRIKFR